MTTSAVNPIPPPDDNTVNFKKMATGVATVNNMAKIIDKSYGRLTVEKARKHIKFIRNISGKIDAITEKLPNLTNTISTGSKLTTENKGALSVFSSITGSISKNINTNFVKSIAGTITGTITKQLNRITSLSTAFKKLNIIKQFKRLRRLGSIFTNSNNFLKGIGESFTSIKSKITSSILTTYNKITNAFTSKISWLKSGLNNIFNKSKTDGKTSKQTKFLSNKITKFFSGVSGTLSKFGSKLNIITNSIPGLLNNAVSNLFDKLLPGSKSGVWVAILKLLIGFFTSPVGIVALSYIITKLQLWWENSEFAAWLRDTVFPFLVQSYDVFLAVIEVLNEWKNATAQAIADLILRMKGEKTERELEFEILMMQRKNQENKRKQIETTLWRNKHQQLYDKMTGELVRIITESNESERTTLNMGQYLDKLRKDPQFADALIDNQSLNEELLDLAKSTVERLTTQAPSSKIPKITYKQTSAHRKSMVNRYRQFMQKSITPEGVRKLLFPTSALPTTRQFNEADGAKYSPSVTRIDTSKIGELTTPTLQNRVKSFTNTTSELASDFTNGIVSRQSNINTELDKFLNMLNSETTENLLAGTSVNYTTILSNSYGQNNLLSNPNIS